MRLLVRTMVVSLLLCPGLSTGSQAQAFDRTCQRIVDALCDGLPVGRCFRNDAMWPYVSDKCTADVQQMIEIEREARQSERVRRPPRQAASFSCGGILRSRPSMASSKVASVAPGQVFDTVEDTGTWHDGYKWFRVTYGGLEGYQWGGIFWVEGGREGTIPSCDG